MVSASVAVPPVEDGPTIGGVGSDVVVFPELGAAPLVDSGVDLEDELPTPDGSRSTVAVQPGEVALPEVCPVLMVTPIVDPVVESVGSLALYPELPLLVLPVDGQVSVLESVQVPVLVSSPLREVAGSLVRDNSPSFLASPAGSVYGPITSPISPSLRMADVPRQPSGMATMVGESTDVPLLQRPLTPRTIVEGMDVPLDRLWVPRPGSLLLRAHSVCQIYLWKAPLMFIRMLRSRGPLHGCWTVCWAVNTR